MCTSVIIYVRILIKCIEKIRSKSIYLYITYFWVEKKLQTNKGNKSRQKKKAIYQYTFFQTNNKKQQHVNRREQAVNDLNRIEKFSTEKQ